MKKSTRRELVKRYKPEHETEHKLKRDKECTAGALTAYSTRFHLELHRVENM